MAQIKIIAGTFGWKHGNAYDLIKAGDPPIEVDDNLAYRLVDKGVAEYAAPTHEAPQEAEEETRLEDMSAKELRALGKQYGLTFTAKSAKAEMIEAILEAMPQDAPEFDAAEAVL